MKPSNETGEPPVGEFTVEAKHTAKPSRKRATPKPGEKNRRTVAKADSISPPAVEANEAAPNATGTNSGVVLDNSEFKRPGVSDETLRAAGISFGDTPELRSLEIHYHDPHGKPTGFCRWRLPRERPDGQKYHQLPGTGTRAYIPPQFRIFAPGGDLVIVEGEFKALALIEAGIKAIGLPSFNTYTRDDKDGPQLLEGIADAIQYTKPDRILFLGDSDTATNYEFARNAVFVSDAVKPIPVVLPRIPVDGPGKGIDDCREALGAEFQKFWTGLVETAEIIDPKAGVGDLAARLLEREATALKASKGAERDKLSRRVLEIAAKCKMEPLARDRVVRFAESNLGFARTALKEALKNTHAELSREAKCRADSKAVSNEQSANKSSDRCAAHGEGEAKNDANPFPIAPAEPWPGSVDGTALLNEMVALLSRLAIPLHRFGVILRHPLALVVAETQIVLRVRLTLFRRLAKPSDRFGVILRHPFALVVDETQIKLRSCIILFRRLAIPLGRFEVILRHTLALFVAETQIVLR